MSEKVLIEGKTRTETGKRATKALRREGLMPANLLSKSGATSIAINPKWLGKANKTGKEFTLELDGKKQDVRIHELHIDHVKRTPLHVDLIRLA